MFTRYHIIRSFEEIKQLVKACKYTKYCCFDYETNGSPLYNASFKPTILSVSFQAGSGVSIPLQHFEMSKEHQEKTWLEWLRYFGQNVLEDPEITKVAHNFKFDNQINEKYGIYYKGTMLDSMLMKYLLNEERPHGLKDLVRRYLPDFANYEDALKDEEGSSKVKWDQIPLEKLCEYGCLDTDCTLRLAIFLESKLQETGRLYPLYRNLYTTMSRVLQETEKNGLYLDKEFNNKLLGEYKPKIDKAIETIYNLPKMNKFQKLYTENRINTYIDKIKEEIVKIREEEGYSKKVQTREQRIANVLAGVYTNNTERELNRRINLNSNKDLQWLMYSEDAFNFPVIKNSDSGAPSTDEETLVNLRLEMKKPDSPKAIFLDSLLELRGLEKMYKTYILGWSEKVQDDSRLHGKYNIHGTTSARLSCLAWDSLVLTDQGEITILEVGSLLSQGKEVKAMTRKGWKRVLKFIYKGEDEMYRVSLKDGRYIECTLKHKFICQDGRTRTLKTLVSSSTPPNKRGCMVYQIDGTFKYVPMHHIRSLGTKSVYDLTIEDCPEFIANGVLNHNSSDPNLQQVPKTSVDPHIKKQLIAIPGTLYFAMDFSQCIEGNSLIFCDTGLKRLKDIKPGIDRICLKDPSWVNSSRVLDIQGLAYKGKAECLKITTNLGRSLILTLDHPVKTVGGFTKARDLIIGQTLYIESMGYSKACGKLKLDPTEAYIAGLMYGDGFYPKEKTGNRKASSRSIGFSTGYDREELRPILEGFFECSFNNPKKKTSAIMGHSPKVVDFYSKYPKKDSHHMSLPSSILEADWDSKMHFIGGQIDSYGSVGDGRFRYTSVCKSYIEELQLLFQSVGFHGIIRKSITHLSSGDFEAYHLIVQSTKALRRLKKYLRLKRKIRDVEDTLRYRRITRKNNPSNAISHCPSTHIPLEVYESKPYTDTFYKTYRNSLRKSRLSRETLKNYLEELIDVDSSWKEVYGFRYETVASIVPCGIHEVYDLSVDKLHEFNPNGIRVHNCELRMMAHLAKDETYLKAFANDEDPHLAVAAQKYGVSYKEAFEAFSDENHPDHKLWKNRRKFSKQIVFGLIYGIQAKLLSVKLSDPKAGLIVTPAEAQEMMDDFFAQHPKIKKFMHTQEKLLKKQGYIESLFGNRRRLPQIFSEDNGEVAYAIRLSTNFPCLPPSAQALSKTKGWVNYSQLEIGDEILAFNPKTCMNEWQPISKVNVFDYKGDMIRMKGRRFDALSTPDHRWAVTSTTSYTKEDLVSKRLEQEKKIIEFEALKSRIIESHNNGITYADIAKREGLSYTKITRIARGNTVSPLCTPLVEPIKFYTSEELLNSNRGYSIPTQAKYSCSVRNNLDINLIKLIGWYVTDGYRRKDGRKIIGQSLSANPHKVKIIDSIFQSLGYHYTRKEVSRKDSTVIKWDISRNNPLSKLLDDLVPNKRLSMRLISLLTVPQLEALLESLRLGDGWKIFASAKEDQASLVQAIVCLCGKSSSMFTLSKPGDKSYFKDGNPSAYGQEYIECKHTSYGIKFSDRHSWNTKNGYKDNNSLSTEYYEGIVWCPTVPSGAWVVRMPGQDNRYRTFITGNCQNPASHMTQFGSILQYWDMKQGKFPFMKEVATVHDAVYYNVLPPYINVYTVWKMWDTFRNPETKKYFGFSIDDVDMSMSFEIGRSMAEELPFIPGYDYNKMLMPDFNIEEYMAEHKKFKDIQIKDYPKVFPELFEEGKKWKQLK